MTREEALTTLRDGRGVWEPFGVSHVSLFGSVARNEAQADSDIDILVEFTRPVGLFEFARLRRELEQLFGRRVDLVTPAALKRQLRDTILREAITVGGQ